MSVWLSICPRVENLFIYVFGYKISSYSKNYRWRRLQSGRLGRDRTGPLGSWGSWEISRKIARSEDSNPKYSPMWKRLQKTFWKKRKWDFWPQIISDFKVFNLDSNFLAVPMFFCATVVRRDGQLCCVVSIVFQILSMVKQSISFWNHQIVTRTYVKNANL